MSQVADIANLIAAFHCQQRLHALETEFQNSSGSRSSARQALRELWPHARKSFYWCAEKKDEDIRAAIACGKMAGVAGHLLEQERGRHQLIEWREIAVQGTERAVARGGLPNNPEFDLVQDLLGHLTYLGYLHYANGNPDRARQVLQRALEVGQEHDRHFADAVALLHLAFVEITAEKLDEGEALLQRALTASADDLATMEAPIRLALGVIYGRRNQPAKARAQYDQIIPLFEAANEFSGLCTALINRGGELLDLELRDLARQDFERADHIARELGSPGHIGLIQANLARLHTHEHPEDGASVLDLLRESKDHFAATGDRVQHARIASMMEGLYQSVLDRDAAETSFTQRKEALWELGNLAADRGDIARALELAERLLGESDASGSDEDRLEVLTQSAHRNLLAQNYAVGRDRARQALAVLERTRVADATDQAATIECNLRSILGQCLRHTGDYEASATEHRAGLAVAELIADEDSISRFRGNLGLALVDQGRFVEALGLLRSVADDLRNSEDYRQAGHAVFNVAYALYRQGDLAAAHKEADGALSLLEMIADPMANEVRRQRAGWAE